MMTRRKFLTLTVVGAAGAVVVAKLPVKAIEWVEFRPWTIYLVDRDGEGRLQLLRSFQSDQLAPSIDQPMYCARNTGARWTTDDGLIQADARYQAQRYRLGYIDDATREASYYRDVATLPWWVPAADEGNVSGASHLRGTPDAHTLYGLNQPATFNWDDVGTSRTRRYTGELAAFEREINAHF